MRQRVCFFRGIDALCATSLVSNPEMNKGQTKSRVAPHSKIIAQAAKESVEPLGIFQMGRSRTWIDDLGWWIVVIEFQPSGFSNGAYLNVAAMWLWHEEDHFTFDFSNDDGS